MRERPGYFRLLLILVIFFSAPAWADSGKELFEKECSGCHTIGGGDSGAPDLKGITGKRPADWLERVIVEPDKLTADKDPVQLGLVKQYGGEMPNLGMSRKDAKKILAYLQDASQVPSSSDTAQPAEPGSKPVETVVTPELVAQGRALFTGGKPFANGGAPCTGCHGFGYAGVPGGNLAVDLGMRIEGISEQVFRGKLKSLNFPIMRKMYADKPLTDGEITALVVFAKDAVARKVPPGGTYYPVRGLAIFVCLIAGFTLYKRRVR
ncbi:MAG TPA: c-type cytochrome [Patescibacteria group bacterium]|nr:c-type cytochrome [Patescibacteria group bacterium]